MQEVYDNLGLQVGSPLVSSSTPTVEPCDAAYSQLAPQQVNTDEVPQGQVLEQAHQLYNDTLNRTHTLMLD